MRGRIRFALGLSAALVSVPSVQGADLVEVYQRAVQNDPLVREAEAIRLAALEAKPRALSALLPQFGVTGAIGQGDSESTSTFPQRIAAGDVVNVPTQRETDSDSVQYQLQLTQSVFHWDQWVALRQASSQVAQAEADYQAAQLDLMLRVSQRYFDVLAAKDLVQSEETARDAIARQLEQAEKRFDVGLIAITDVQEAKAAYDNAAAAVIRAKRNLATAHELLRELTGDAIGVLSAPSDSMPLQTPDPQSEEQWVKTALEQNLALISSRLAADIARDTIGIRRAGHFPQLDLVLRRNDFDSNATTVTTDLTSSTVTEGPTDSDSTDDQIQLQLNFPIYSGGAVQSSVREATYLARAARERLERTTRETERATRDAYLGVLSEISRVQALKQARESSRTALQATEAGYEVGTRTTVDVLDARRTLAIAETNYARSRYDYIINLVQLKLAAGILKPEDITEINSWLQVPTPLATPATPPAS